jgi:hypothetical protein
MNVSNHAVKTAVGRRFSALFFAFPLLCSLNISVGTDAGEAGKKDPPRQRDLLDEISREVRGKDYDQNRDRLAGFRVKDPRGLSPEKLEEIKARIGDKGLGMVSAADAALCPACGKPLFMHSDPNFECIPLDPLTKKPLAVAKIKYQNAICPVCQAEFPGPERGNLNERLGVDRDLCRHSMGKAVVHGALWMCPRCGYAAVAGGFNNAVDDDLKTFVQTTLKEPTQDRIKRFLGWKGVPVAAAATELTDFERFINQTDIPDWLKYENAVKLYERQKAGNAFMAMLYLDAAHAARREVCAPLEVPGLDAAMQSSMGKSVRKIEAILSALCMEYRRSRNEEILTPMYLERDPYVLAFVIYQLLLWDEKGDGPLKEKPELRLTLGDLCALLMRYAGVLDRCGYPDKADGAFQRAEDVLSGAEATADRYVRTPKQAQAKAQTPAARLAPLKDAITERRRLLNQECEHLGAAAWRLMGALKHNEDPKRVEPLRTAYLIGELFRRCGGEDAALSRAWFDAAERLSAGASADDDSAHIYGMWTDQQKSLLPPPTEKETIDPKVHEVIAEVLRRAGVADTKPPKKDEPQKPTTNDDAANAAAPQTTSPAAGDGRREALLRICWEALRRWKKERGTNAPGLKILTEEGFLDNKLVKLDEGGDLICPETGKSLMYASTAGLDDPTASLIFPLLSDPCRLSLFGDGQIRVPERK